MTTPSAEEEASPREQSGSRASVSFGTPVFVDAVQGRHVAPNPKDLLDRRRLMWDNMYGWIYDCWVDDAARYALAGANSRFALPAIAAKLSQSARQAVQAAQSSCQGLGQLLQQAQQAASAKQPAPAPEQPGGEEMPCGACAHAERGGSSSSSTGARGGKRQNEITIRGGACGGAW